MKKLIALIVITIFSFDINAQEVKIEDLDKGKANSRYGIVGKSAPELIVEQWVDDNGENIDPFKLSDHKGKFKVIYCFQAWCPGCHSIGLPSLKKMTEALKDSDKVIFAAIQTVFEGRNANTFERMLEIQKEYDLKIPFGHDDGKGLSKNIATTMLNYKTGGTPWFILIDENDKVVFNDYHMNTDKAIEYLKNL